MRHILLFIAAFIIIPTAALAYRIPDRDAWRVYTLNLINMSRDEENLPLLSMDEELNDIAQAHAADSATHFDDSSKESRRATYLKHISSDRRELGDRIREYGMTGGVRYGENVGFRLKQPFTDVYAVLEESTLLMHNGMMAELPPDDGHRKTILGDFTHVGIGLELQHASGNNRNTIFFVTDFGKFTDKGRSVVIPEFGPAPIPPVSIEEAKARTKEITGRRVRVRRRIDRRARRVIEENSSHEETKEQTPPRRKTWAEKNNERMQKRRIDRLDRLKKRVEERRMKRINRSL